MELLHIIYTSIGSVVALFILTKFIGYRQMSQLSMFDYINGITIGSIAAEMATSLEDDFLKPLIAMVVYSLAAVLLSLLAEKSMVARRIIIGKAVIIFDKDTLYLKHLQKAHMDLDEFLSQCRINGYFNLDDIQTAVLEPNGHISFLPKADKRPVTPKDMELNPSTEMIVANVIVDGHIMNENLRRTGHDTQWLKNQLKAFDVHDIGEVLLATCDIDNKVCVYRKTKSSSVSNVLN